MEESQLSKAERELYFKRLYTSFRIADANYKHQEHLVFNLINHPIILLWAHVKPVQLFLRMEPLCAFGAGILL